MMQGLSVMRKAFWRKYLFDPGRIMTGQVFVTTL